MDTSPSEALNIDHMMMWYFRKSNDAEFLSNEQYVDDLFEVILLMFDPPL